MRPVALPRRPPAEEPPPLDAKVCDRARVSRDARFDGRFFSGVLTTRIYCRPICPVRPARSEHVVFFPTAAAAERAGFRPCLRCRPEAAPGSPAWQGAAATVSRALALIDRGALDEGSVSDLAARLGMGPRHLGRLFLRYVGASPTAAGRTRRVQLAKTLLTETAMPLADVAFAAGFQSVRRFNAVFRNTYQRPPSAVRRLRREAPLDGGPITLRLAYRPPFYWSNVVRLLGAEHTPGVEEMGLDGYRRTIALDGRAGWLSVRPVASAHQIELCVSLPEHARLRAVVERVRLMFDLSADPQRIARQLAMDPALVPLLRLVRGVRLPGAWDGFEVAVAWRVLQDVGPSRARQVMEGLASALGRRLEPRPERGPSILFPEAAALAEASPAALGLSRRGARDLRRLAAATAAGAIRFDGSACFEELVGELTGAGGFDARTAHWIAMRSLAEPDAIALAGAGGAAQRRWRPWRSYVAALHALARLHARRRPGHLHTP